MVFDPANAVHLKPWLVRTLEPICDAEPGALADYILALLTHNGPEQEMRKELEVQLEEFLEKECTPFLDTLFTALRSKSYLPYNTTHSSPKAADAGIPIPLDGLVPPGSPSHQSRKRSLSNDGRDGRPPAKGARLDNGGSHPRYGNGAGAPSGNWQRGPQGGPSGPMDAFAVGAAMMGMNPMGYNRRQHGYQPPSEIKKGYCRDYFNTGWCSRGAACKYSHGDDALLPNQLYHMGNPAMGMPYMPMFPGPQPGMPFMIPNGGYDPSDSRMDMRPRQHQRAPLLSRAQQEEGNLPPGELPVIQDLTPVIPPDPSVTSSTSKDALPSSDVDMQASARPIPLPIPQHQQHPQVLPVMPDMGYNPMDSGPYPQPMPVGDVDMSSFQQPPHFQPHHLQHGQGQPPAHTLRPFRGRNRGGGGGGGGRGAGGFPSDAHTFRPEKRREDKTLVVEKIPDDKLSLESVNNWFKQFGKVTNVAIDASPGGNNKALVSFETHEEAHRAWKTEEAVFGNRFVKVYWHRPMEGHGQVGQMLLKASAGVVAGVNGSGGSSSSSSAAAASVPPTAPAPMSISRKPSGAPTAGPSSGLAAKQASLEQKIAEQKTLMASLETAPGADAKKEIMTKLRLLNQQVKVLTSAIQEETASMTSARKGSTTGASSAERAEKEKLDKELESRRGDEGGGGGISVSVSGSGEAMETEVGGGEEKVDDLKSKLERLKAEAASLGLDGSSPTAAPVPPPAPPHTMGYRGGYRGRGRGGARGYYRGGAPHMPAWGSMKLDNRPKKLLVKGVPEEHLQTLKDWYETTGFLDSVESLGGGGSEGALEVVVAFKTRGAAEQGLAKGSNIPLIGSVQIGWYTGTASGSATTSGSAKPGVGAPSTSGTGSSKAVAPGVSKTVSTSSEIEVDDDGAGGGPSSASPSGMEVNGGGASEHEHEHMEEATLSGWGVDEDDGRF